MTPFMENKLAEIADLASGFSSRAAFKASHPDKYKWLSKYGLIGKAMPHTSREGVWDYDKVLKAAESCNGRNEFFEQYGGAVGWAQRNGCLDEILSKIPRLREQICPVKVRDAAMQCKTRHEFYRKFTSYYSWCLRNDALDEYCAHMASPLVFWTVDEVSELAKDFQYRKDFERAHPNAFRWATRTKNSDVVFAHMDRKTSASDYDIIYMWTPCGFPDVFKVGVTSERLGDRRINEVALRGRLEVASIIKAKVSCARSIEAKLLGLGSVFDFGRRFTGSTEFRFYLPEQFDKCLDILQPYRRAA